MHVEDGSSEDSRTGTLFLGAEDGCRRRPPLRLPFHPFIGSYSQPDKVL